LPLIMETPQDCLALALTTASESFSNKSVVNVTASELREKW